MNECKEPEIVKSILKACITEMQVKRALFSEYNSATGIYLPMGFDEYSLEEAIRTGMLCPFGHDHDAEVKELLKFCEEKKALLKDLEDNRNWLKYFQNEAGSNLMQAAERDDTRFLLNLVKQTKNALSKGAQIRLALSAYEQNYRA